jgi:hypothetical protein
MSQDDLEYYRRRASTERALAKASERANVSAIHEELAHQYEALVEHEELRPPFNSAAAGGGNGGPERRGLRIPGLFRSKRKLPE